MSSVSPIPAKNDHEVSSDKAGDESRSSIKSPTETDDFTPKKPDFSYNALIIMALKSNPDKKLTVHGIYKYIQDKYPFFLTTTLNWKNSIRHHLSANNWFVKIKRGFYEKGAYWMLDESYGDEMYLVSRGRRRASRAKNALTKSLGVTSPILLPPCLPTSIPAQSPNPFFRVGAPMPFIPTPMMMPPTQVDFQVFLLWAQQQLQYHWIQPTFSPFPKIE